MAFIFKKTVQSSLKMANFFPKIRNISRTLTTSRSLTSNYEGDGKTTVTILNREHKNLIMIDTYSQLGFRLNNGIYALGPLAAFPRTILQWNVNSIEEMTPECFSLFCLLDPKLDILIIGTGDYRKMPGKEILKYLQSNKVSVEILSTEQAISLFNFLNAEGRCVAGAFIPPVSLLAYPEEMKILDTIDSIDEYNIEYPKKID